MFNTNIMLKLTIRVRLLPINAMPTPENILPNAEAIDSIPIVR